MPRQHTGLNGDGTLVLSLIQKASEAGDKTCNLWTGSLCPYPLYNGCFYDFISY